VSHANRGAAWERTLDGWHDLYALQGQALLVRSPPPLRMLGPGLRAGTFTACYTAAAPPDYTGLVQVGGVGLAVCFDAKACAAKRWPLSKLPLHQATHFAWWERMGGRAGVLLLLGTKPYLLPWGTWAGTPGIAPAWQRWSGGSAPRGWASLDRAACEDLGLAVDPRKGWLAALHGRLGQPATDTP